MSPGASSSAAVRHPLSAERVEPMARIPGDPTRADAGAGEAWSKVCGSSDALYTLCFRTYDAGTVSRSTGGGLLYGATACAPWIVREASPPAPRPPRLLDRVREAIGSRHYSRRTEKPTSTGSGGSSSFTASGTPPSGLSRSSSATVMSVPR